MNELEKYQFEIMKNLCIGEGDEIDKLILRFNWTEKQTNIFFDVCDKYWNMPASNWTYADFENDLKILNINYQDIKSIIIVFHDSGRYSNLVYNYLDSNKKSIGNLSMEYNRIAKALGI